MGTVHTQVLVEVVKPHQYLLALAGQGIQVCERG
jgi:hypothetical protein